MARNCKPFDGSRGGDRTTQGAHCGSRKCVHTSRAGAYSRGETYGLGGRQAYSPSSEPSQSVNNSIAAATRKIAIDVGTGGKRPDAKGYGAVRAEGVLLCTRCRKIRAHITHAHFAVISRRGLLGPWRRKAWAHVAHANLAAVVHLRGRKFHLHCQPPSILNCRRW